MAQNTVYGTKFYLTSRASEQLPKMRTKAKKEAFDNPFISDYISTVEQESDEDKKFNSAVSNNALASFNLGRNDMVSAFNAYMRQVQLNERQ